MKVKLALYSTIVFSALSLPNLGFAQSFPTCFSSSSDSDGDGYGWENNATCLVDANSGTNMTGQCEDRGGYPWGWNPTTLTSCRLDEQVSEKHPLEQVVVGEWSLCEPYYLRSPFHNPTSGNNRGDEVSSANWQRFVPNASGVQGTNEGISSFDFKGNGEVSIQYLFNSNTGWLNTHQTTWGIVNFSLAFADVPGSFGISTTPQNLAFENVNGIETLHMYMTTTYRISCMK